MENLSHGFRLRLRVAHKLFLLLAMTIGLALLALGALTVHNLRRGFVDYVNTLDLARLDPLARALEQRTDATNAFAGLHDHHRWSALLRDTLTDRPGPEPRSAAGEARAERLRPPPPPPPPPPPRSGGDVPPPPMLLLPPRVSLLDAQGQMIAGAMPWPAALRRPLMQNGALVGYLALRPLNRPVDSRDTDFLSAQIHAMAVLASLLLLLAVGVAWFFARHLLAPLRTVEHAARQLSEGRYGLALSSPRGDELGDLVRHVNRLSQSLKAHETARQRWMADISHELRTPLSIVRGELEAMRDGVRSPDARGLASLHEEVMRLGRLVDDLHQWSMADAGSLSYRPQSLDLAVLAGEACARFQGAAREAGLALESLLVPAIVTGDPDRLCQLLDNLIGNSLRYSDRGGRVQVRVAVEGDSAVMSVDDTPPGVPTDALTQLFEPLYRGEQSRNRAHGGSGLGLAIAQRIAVAHGSELSAQPSPLGGLRIALQLPLERC